MTLKEKFSDDDWAQVLEAPMLAGVAITAADPSGLIGAVQESVAMAGSLKSASEDGGEGTLAHAISEAYKTSEGRSQARNGVKVLLKGKRPAEVSEAAVSRLGNIVNLVERVAPEEAALFRNFIIDTAQRTAEASTEGGFLGFGGEKVSDAERKTLDDLSSALGLAGV